MQQQEYSLTNLILSSITKLGYFRRFLCFDYFGVSRYTPKNYSVSDLLNNKPVGLMLYV